ncbi:oligopeptide/dipeptide ABC transporter ATP-binding protein [Candidatus Enterococcus ferrettii]|uniref:Peptide/nickel transport system ATP-binding protein n=1 Tax=Candidatus Enterococcus ferrettii TaxID=2815324 RepID=A0ABV0EJW6_9ENTE|nr:ABC transporter ATP-binding protein [Enterococcus sp. 665A]
MNKPADKVTKILEIKQLKVKFPIHKKWLPAVDEVDLTIHAGEIIGIVGESGSGKSVMSQSILRLRDHDTAVQYEGEILFEGNDLLQNSLAQLREIRGNDISIIFQDPLNSLSPVHTVEKQLSEVITLHKQVSKDEAKKRSIEMLNLTGIPDPAACLKKYPFELSGGMQQRVMIAMALACEPKLLIADEPTTALDVTIQEQILRLIKELNETLGMSVLFITHDMGVVAKLCHRIKVMYLGQIVEDAATEELFAEPLHPYTEGLISCIPHLETKRGEPLPTIPGTVPSLSEIPKGCHFCTRCKYADERCFQEQPPMIEARPDHFVKCWRYDESTASRED